VARIKRFGNYEEKHATWADAIKGKSKTPNSEELPQSQSKNQPELGTFLKKIPVEVTHGT
jgi:hypothetical protein